MEYSDDDKLQLFDEKRANSAQFTRYTRCATQETLNVEPAITGHLPQTYGFDDLPDQTERPDVKLLIEKFEALRGPSVTKGASLKRQTERCSTLFSKPEGSGSAEIGKSSRSSTGASVSTGASMSTTGDFEYNETCLEYFDICDGTTGKLRSMSRLRPATIPEEYEKSVIYVPRASFQRQVEMLEESRLHENCGQKTKGFPFRVLVSSKGKDASPSTQLSEGKEAPLSPKLPEGRTEGRKAGWKVLLKPSMSKARTMH